MAYDKAVDSTKLETGLTTIADAIRAKGGTSAPLDFPQGMADAVAAIPEGGGECNTLNVVPYRASTASGMYSLYKMSFGQPFRIVDVTTLPTNMVPLAYCKLSSAPDGYTVNIHGTNVDEPFKGGDVFRQLEGATEINFVDGWYPKETWRTLYQMQSPAKAIKIRGVFLDFVTSMTSIGYLSTTLDIEWAGELINDAEFQFIEVTPETVKRLIPLLHDYSAGPAHTLTIGSAVSNLTQGEIQTANAKGWTIA